MVFICENLKILDNSTYEDSESKMYASKAMKKVDRVSTVNKNTVKLTESLRDACLPKMLCEMSAKSPHQLNDKEKSLLELIR